MDIGVQVFGGHMILVILDIHLGMELLDHVVTLCLNFKELPNHCLTQVHEDLFLFSVGSITVLSLPFMSMFTVNFCVLCKVRTKSTFLHVDIQFCQHRLLRRLFISH